MTMPTGDAQTSPPTHDGFTPPLPHAAPAPAAAEAGPTVADVAAALDRIEAARARADAASVGPWIEDDGFVHGGEIQSGDRWARRELIATCGQERNESDADAAFIAHARADVPLLATIAAAAVRLAMREGRTVLPSPWWANERRDHWYSCKVCYNEGQTIDQIQHDDDCPALELDAAIRAAGEAGHV